MERSHLHYVNKKSTKSKQTNMNNFRISVRFQKRNAKCKQKPIARKYFLQKEFAN